MVFLCVKVAVHDVESLMGIFCAVRINASDTNGIAYSENGTERPYRSASHTSDLPLAHRLPLDHRCKTNCGRITLLPALTASCLFFLSFFLYVQHNNDAYTHYRPAPLFLPPDSITQVGTLGHRHNRCVFLFFCPLLFFSFACIPRLFSALAFCGTAVHNASLALSSSRSLPLSFFSIRHSLPWTTIYSRSRCLGYSSHPHLHPPIQLLRSIRSHCSQTDSGISRLLERLVLRTPEVHMSKKGICSTCIWPQSKSVSLV